MASINFTDFDTKTSLLSGDFLVGYKQDGSAEFRTTINDIVNYLKTIFIQKSNDPIYVTINDNGFVMNLNTDEKYYFTVDETVNSFKFLIGGLDGVNLQNNFNINDFNDCNLGITTTNLIASDVPSLYVTQKCTLSTIKDEFFTLYYYNTGSLVLGFSLSSVELEPPTPTPSNYRIEFSIDDGNSTVVNEVTEGTYVVATLYADVNDLTEFPYTITGVSESDIDIPLEGTFVMSAGNSFLPFNISADAITDGSKTMVITLNNVEPVVSGSLIINDTVNPLFCLQEGHNFLIDDVIVYSNGILSKLPDTNKITGLTSGAIYTVDLDADGFPGAGIYGVNRPNEDIDGIHLLIPYGEFGIITQADYQGSPISDVRGFKYVDERVFVEGETLLFENWGINGISTTWKLKNIVNPQDGIYGFVLGCVEPTPTPTPTETPVPPTPTPTPTETPVPPTPTPTPTPTTSNFDIDALDYINRVENADGEELESEIKIAIDNLVKGLKQDNIWYSLSGACLMAGPRTLNGALTPLVGPVPINHNFTQQDLNRSLGLKGTGETWLDSQIKSNELGNDRHFGFYVTRKNPLEPFPRYETLIHASDWIKRDLSNQDWPSIIPRLFDMDFNTLATQTDLGAIWGALRSKLPLVGGFGAVINNVNYAATGLYSIDLNYTTRNLRWFWGNYYTVASSPSVSINGILKRDTNTGNIIKIETPQYTPHYFEQTIADYDLSEYLSDANITIFGENDIEVQHYRTRHVSGWYSLGNVIDSFKLQQRLDTYFESLWSVIPPPPDPTPTPTPTPTPWNQKALYAANSVPLVVDVEPVNNEVDARFRFDQIGSNCPTLTCFRGTNYDFIVKNNNHPFALRIDLYTVGDNVDGTYNNDAMNGITDNVIYFTPNNNTPDSIVYVDTLYPSNSGVIQIKNYE